MGGVSDTWLGWGSAPSSYKNRHAPPNPPIPPGSSMIAILAMPQMKTRVAATIHKS